MNPVLLYEDPLPGGASLSLVLRRHCTLRLTAPEGGANVALLAHRAAQPLDRLNLPDTLKSQHTARLTRGHVLMSDMGHALLSVTADTAGGHDPLGGHGDAALTLAKYGETSYQTHRNARFRNARDNLLVELGKHGLGERDLTANVNFFSLLDVDDDGRLAFRAGHCQPGATVDLRAETDVLVTLDANPHPLDPAPAYQPGRVLCSVWRTPPPGPDDFCRTFRPENGRAFQLTERLHAGDPA